MTEENKRPERRWVADRQEELVAYLLANRKTTITDIRAALGGCSQLVAGYALAAAACPYRGGLLARHGLAAVVTRDGEVFVGRPAHTITHNILPDDGPMVRCPDLASERKSVAPRRYEPIPVR